MFCTRGSKHSSVKPRFPAKVLPTITAAAAAPGCGRTDTLSVDNEDDDRAVPDGVGMLD